MNDHLQTKNMASYLEKTAKVPVLLAEDDEVSRQILHSQLEAWGYAVESYSEGMKAIMALRRKDAPQVAILDWTMPGMEGPDIVRRLRQAERVLYVIILTAKGQREQMIEALDAGADDFLVKPCDPDELLARLKVGIRVTDLQNALEARIIELEEISGRTRREFGV